MHTMRKDDAAGEEVGDSTACRGSPGGHVFSLRHLWKGNLIIDFEQSFNALHELNYSGEQVFARALPAQGKAASMAAADPAGECKVQVQHLWKGQQDQQRSFESQVEVSPAKHGNQDSALHSKRVKSRQHHLLGS